jgi:hypothetical protein
LPGTRRARSASAASTARSHGPRQPIWGSSSPHYDTWVGVAGGTCGLARRAGSIVLDVGRAAVAAKTAKGDVRVAEVVRGSVALETRVGDLVISRLVAGVRRPPGLLDA